MSDDSEPDPDAELLEDLGPIFAELAGATSGDSFPDPIIGRLAEQYSVMPVAETQALVKRLAPADREAFFYHLALSKHCSDLVVQLWDSLLERRTPNDVPVELRDAELGMTVRTHVVLQRWAWKLVVYMQGADLDTKAAVDALRAEDPEFRELTKTVATLMQWHHAEPHGTHE